MNDWKEIQQLKQDLERYEADLKNIGEGIKKLKTTNLQALQAKDKEIQNLENKLLACQQKSANLQWANQQERNEISSRLMKALGGCASQKDKIIDHLLKPCATCEGKSKAVKDLKCLRNWLIGSNSLLLLIILTFAYLVYRCRWWKKLTIKNYELRK